MRKEITYEEYNEMLGKVPEGKRLVQTNNFKFYIEDKVIVPLFITKKSKKEEKK